jgi:hypothetical protein
MKKRKKVSDILFAVCFVAVLLVPFLMLDTKTETSELENRTLTKWPGLYFDKLHTEWYGHYVEDRVGFRNAAITLNADVTYQIFGEFSEDLHMFGKDGYIFPADEGYVQNYQRLNIDEELMDNLMCYLSNTNAYVKENDGLFVFMICPNKSSVYGDKMPDSICVDESHESTLDMAKRKLDALEIPYVIPDEEFRRLKENEQIYNQKYDCAHWNALGAFYGLSMVDEVVRKTYPDIPVMEQTDFTLTWETQEGLEFFAASQPLEDTIPQLTCSRLSSDAVQTDSPYRVDVTVESGNNIAYFYNETALSDKKVLILHDSFLDNRESWYTYRYREVYYGSRVNYTHMQEYIDRIQPDVVIFELAERAFADDLGAYTQLAELRYE